MANTSQSFIDNQVGSEIRTIAENILNQLELGHTEEAVALVNNLNQVREKTLFNELGKLTRSLHDAIKNLHVEEAGTKGSEFTQTADKLNYVLEMTDKSANKTMDLAEAAMPIISRMSERSNTLSLNWKKLIKKELSTEEFRQLSKDIDKHLTECVDQSQVMQGHLSEIVLAQDFQDLTGQVIQKVIELIVDVEGRLVSLLSMAGSLDKLSGFTHMEMEKTPLEEDKNTKAEGPQIDKTKENVMQSQDDVDDLLSSLGF